MFLVLFALSQTVAKILWGRVFYFVLCDFLVDFCFLIINSNSSHLHSFSFHFFPFSINEIISSPVRGFPQAISVAEGLLHAGTLVSGVLDPPVSPISSGGFLDS